MVDVGKTRWYECHLLVGKSVDCLSSVAFYDIHMSPCPATTVGDKYRKLQSAGCNIENHKGSTHLKKKYLKKCVIL